MAAVSSRTGSFSTLIPAAVAVAGMIATPLASRGGRTRRRLSSLVVVGLAAVTGSASARRWTPPRAAAAAAAVSGATLVVERVGSRTGVPFGRYRYSGALRPTVAGVPAIVPIAWFSMAVPARTCAHVVLGGRSGRCSRGVLGAAALTAWDLFLDPQMVAEGFWTWTRRGRYRGIPLSNFVGWFVTGLGVMALLEATLPIDGDAPQRASNDERAEEPVLVATYAFMAAMETLGFAVFFRDRLVAAVGGAAMVPLATIATARTLRARSRG